MAVTPHKIPVTREMVYSWIESWDDDSDQTLEDHIRTEVDVLNLPDAVVDTQGHENLGDEVPLADFILMDLESYTNAPGN